MRDVSAFDFDTAKNLLLFDNLVNNGLHMGASVILNGADFLHDVVNELMQ